jgi:translation initiation factor 1
MALRKLQPQSPVYSTEHGKMCPACARPVKECSCRHRQQQPGPGDGVVRVSRETKGRKGAGVTIITGIPLHHAGLVDLARELKRRCGSGGTVKGDRLEIQGDHRDLMVAEMTRRGWKVKRSGG